MTGFMNYADEFGLGVMIYISRLIEITSRIQKLLGGDRHADTQTAK
jgi:hypothetical protein